MEACFPYRKKKKIERFCLCYSIQLFADIVANYILAGKVSDKSDKRIMKLTV